MNQVIYMLLLQFIFIDFLLIYYLKNYMYQYLLESLKKWKLRKNGRKNKDE